MTGVSIPPSLPAGTPAPGAHPPGTSPPEVDGPVTGKAVDLPAALLRLAGTIINGTVIGQNAAGLTAVRTDAGVLSLALNRHLPANSKLSIEVRANDVRTGAAAQVIILSIEPPPEGEMPAPSSAAAIRTAGVVVTAVVIQPAVLQQLQKAAIPVPPRGTLPGGTLPVEAQTLPAAPFDGMGRAGGPVTALPSGAAPPIAGPLTASPTIGLPDGASLGRLPVTTSPAADIPAGIGRHTARSTPGAPFPVGAQINLRIIGFLPPAGDPSLSAPPGPMVAGTVAAITPAGNPVVQTAQGIVVLGTRTALPVGSQILFEVVPRSQATTVRPLAEIAPSLALSRDWNWPALAEALLALHRKGSDGSAQSAPPLPQAGPRLAAGLLNFLATFGGGDPASWLGGTIREAFEGTEQRELAGRVRQELAQLSHLAAEASGDEWRLVPLPLLDEAGLHKVRLYLRQRRRNADPAERRPGGARFIVEVELTRLGALQLDGLIQERRFDLMLRSRIPLSARIRHDITEIYDQARAIAGFTGSMEFATTAIFPVVPLDRARPGSDGVMV